ncbi:MAG: ATP-binding cassette protein [Flavipsychrobacter sp.]|jgi:putative ABC transport system ATP-binding protein|nr:ATP-binding cassette protein [Flavipsychrobacter sp.]
MQLELEQLIPIPLADEVRRRTSAIWARDVLVNKGEYVFVQAPSGTGKTTLIHFLYGVRRDYHGAVKWNGQSAKGFGTEKLSELRAGKLSIIFQDMRLFPRLTAWENLGVKRTLTNSVEPQIVKDWMARLGIADKADSMAGTLSYGEQQRVAIIRALLQPFNWLLMDEPFSHLDRMNIERAIELIKEVVSKNNAGLILADLEDNDYFPYTQKLVL